MLPGPAHDRALPADRRSVGAPQRLLGQRRPARARVVRHLAQAREHRHGPHADAAALLRPGQRPVQRDRHLSVQPGHPDAAVLRRRRHAHPLRPARDRRGRGSGPPLPPLPLPPVPLPPLPLARSARTATATSPASVPTTTSDTLVWSPLGAACGRPIDQWSMGGISIPANTAGLLAPCANDDQPTQAGPWATDLHVCPVPPCRDRRRTDHRHRVRQRDDVGDRARGRTRGRHAQRRLLPAHRGRAARVAAGREPEPVLELAWD